ncbi:putative mariner transposase [Trichonephila clavipes]|nr:putative mariner transposase [Trichonephila clavipes]
MSDNEQRCAIKFCFRLGHNPTETFSNLQQAYGDNVLSRAQVFGGLMHFQKEESQLKMNLAAECPQFQKTAENVVRVRDLVQSDRRLAVRMIGEEPPCSPDLSPCDFFLFPKLKNHLKGHHFGTLENIQTAVTDQLKVIPISDFHQCYEEWKKRLQRCVASEGSYFDGDNVELQVGQIGESLVIWIEAMRPLEDDGKNGWTMVDFRVIIVAVDLGPQQFWRTD